MDLEGWKRKEGAKKETFIREHEGSLFLYEKSGSARQFFRMIGLEREPISVLPVWIQEQLKKVSDEEQKENEKNEPQKNENKDNTNAEKRDNKIDESGTKQMDASGKQLCVADTSKNSINSIVEILDGSRIIAFSDIENLKKLSQFDRLLLFQKTPKQLVRQRRGFLLPSSASKDKKLLTDSDYMIFQYVDSMTMQQEANLAFLYEWSVVVESEKWNEQPKEVVVRGYVQVEINGKLIQRACAGSCIQKGMMDMGDTLESAISEMKKRGLKSFGFNSDVYRQEEIE